VKCYIRAPDNHSGRKGFQKIPGKSNPWASCFLIQILISTFETRSDGKEFKGAIRDTLDHMRIKPQGIILWRLEQ
jgi:hypothetical protein